MEQIFKAIEEKLERQESTIAIQKWEIADLERKLKEAEETIRVQKNYIGDLKGERK